MTGPRNRETLERCPYCNRAYRRGDGEPEWCRTCPEGLRHQDAETQRLVRHNNAEWDRAEAEMLEQA